MLMLVNLGQVVIIVRSVLESLVAVNDKFVVTYFFILNSENKFVILYNLIWYDTISLLT